MISLDVDRIEGAAPCDKCGDHTGDPIVIGGHDGSLHLCNECALALVKAIVAELPDMEDEEEDELEEPINELNRQALQDAIDLAEDAVDQLRGSLAKLEDNDEKIKGWTGGAI